MKLPRWLVIAMLTTSVLGVLAAAGWWWVTWPERTAREFLELLAAGKVERAKQMADDPSYHLPSGVNDPSLWDQANLTSSNTSLKDVLTGRRFFVVQSPKIDPCCPLIVKRGFVIHVGP